MLTVVVPLIESAPGPGRPTAPSTSELPEAGMQTVAPRAVVKVPRPARARGCPTSRMSRAPANPKAPAVVWARQKAPFGAGSMLVPVVAGTRLTGSVPMN